MTQASSLSVHHGDIHLTSIISASAAPDTQTTVAGLSLINPSSVPLVYCPPWCHTLFLSLSVCIHHANTHRKSKRKKKREKRYAHQVRDLLRKCSPSENPVTGRMATEGRPPDTTHWSSVCLALSEPERSETLPHYTINAQSGNRREAVTGCRMNPSCFAVSVIYNAADTWLWGWPKVIHLHSELHFYLPLVKECWVLPVMDKCQKMAYKIQ